LPLLSLLFYLTMGITQVSIAPADSSSNNSARSATSPVVRRVVTVAINRKTDSNATPKSIMKKKFTGAAGSIKKRVSIVAASPVSRATAGTMRSSTPMRSISSQSRRHAVINGAHRRSASPSSNPTSTVVRTKTTVSVASSSPINTKSRRPTITTVVRRSVSSSKGSSSSGVRRAKKVNRSTGGKNLLKTSQFAPPLKDNIVRIGGYGMRKTAARDATK
ncbi:hypothetical protein PFISCL1PPCAC_18942, partial [Pristionchus fissidentatus]